VAQNKKAIIGELCHRRSRPEMHPASLFILIWLAWAVSWTLIALWFGRTQKRLATWNVWTDRVLMQAGAARSSSHTGRQERLASNECGMSICRCYAPAGVTLAGVLFAWWARIHLGRLETGSPDKFLVPTGAARYEVRASTAVRLRTGWLLAEHRTHPDDAPQFIHWRQL
jgi:hypothetical protein